VAILLFASAAAAQEEQFFEPPADKPRVTFQWDALARYDDTYHLRRPPPLYNEVERGRFEFRPELGVAFSDRLRVAVRAVGDLGTDHASDNAVNFDNYRSRGATLERWYVEARPGQLTIDAGSFGMPLLSTEMLWDKDIQTPGLAASWQIATGGSTLTLAGAGFYGPQREGDRTRIGVGQVVWRVGDPLRFSVDVAAAYWYFDPRDLKPAYFRQNAVVVRGGVREYASRFRILDGIVRLRFPIGPVPATVSLDVAGNTAAAPAADHGRTAFEGSLTLGRVGKRGDWRFFYTFQYVERDAVMGAYNTDDWWFHSWYRGHRAALAYTLVPDVYLQASVVFQKRLDLKNTLNRVMVDVAKLF
jgi:hypothetical protein